MRRAPAATLAVVATMATLVLAAAPVSAVGAAETGWWTAAPAVVVASDVPPGGVLLQGGATAEQPLAFAAVSYALAAGEEPTELTLTVADGSATTPNAAITACPLTEAFTPAEGGPMSEAPAFDCASSVAAERSDDGATFTLDVGALVADGTLAFALLPSALTDRVVLAPPGAPSVASGGSGLPPPASGSSAPPATSPAPGRTSVPAPSVPAPGGVVTPAPTIAPAAPATTLVSEPAAALPSSGVPSSDDGGSPRAAVAFVALVVLIGALWLTAGNAGARPDDDDAEVARAAAAAPWGGQVP